MQFGSADVNSLPLGSFDILPDDIVVEILKRLDAVELPKRANLRAVSRVSKLWYELSNVSVCNLSLSGFKAAKVERILSRFSRLSSLNLTFLFDCNEDVLQAVGKHCGLLKEIHISESYKSMDGQGINAMTRGCTNLELLSLHGYKGPEGPLCSIGDWCQSLQSLRLRSICCMTDQTIEHIASRCTKLEDLDISLSSQLTDDSLRAIGKHLPHLKRLDLKHCKLISGHGVAAVAEGCPLLENLHLGVVEVGDIGLRAIGLHSAKLEELYLDYGWGKYGQLSREAMSVVAHGCKNLRRLSMRGSKQVDDIVLQGLERGCPSLMELDLHACEKVGDRGLEAVVKGCKQLKELVLSGSNIGSSGRDPFALHGGLPNLRSIRMNGDMISDAMLKSIGEKCQNLLEIHLSCCSNVTDKGLVALLLGCSSLSCITVKSSPLVRGSAFETVPCPAMASISFPSCGVDDHGLLSVAKNCPNLAYLSVSGCQSITAVGLVNFVAACPPLKDLLIVGCLQLTRADLIGITKAARSNLRTMRVSRPDSPEDEYNIKRNYGGWLLPNWARSASV
eukprot:TRINITY_DN235_c0_g1_i1.p1 TRINITY_DN235_c0_g1~~TRINITY_DN235_c0_g1_i1.p1  ORF type:complete len:562 (-),score=96.54 TRINITY_DN235_c0_g1_i1:250-1935(-)